MQLKRQLNNPQSGKGIAGLLFTRAGCRDCTFNQRKYPCRIVNSSTPSRNVTCHHKEEIHQLKPIMLVGILLIVLEVFVITYKGTTYSKWEKIAGIGSIEATNETHKSIPLSPILGGLAIAGKIGLVVIGDKK